MESEKKFAVAGYLFNEDRTHVVMIHKRRPSYLYGRLVPPGGKVEPGEDFLNAMVREYREETGLTIDSWSKVCTFTGDNGTIILVYRAFGAIYSAETMTDEKVVVVSVDRLPPETWTTCKWEIPLCLDEKVASGFRLDEKVASGFRNVHVTNRNLSPCPSPSL